MNGLKKLQWSFVFLDQFKRGNGTPGKKQISTHGRIKQKYNMYS
jgi:hypothetical protein